MAATVGVARSAVRRQAIKPSTEQQLQERRWDTLEILAIYRRRMGITAGATGNAVAVKELLIHLREHGLATDRKYLFVINRVKTLRAAIEEVFGTGQPVQR